ncbi:hypothetical protein RSOLAG1IB_12474 [Rhizoctonia solani AG-1 IB]|uniref:Uncharacterized protein n=1 Tax=Thanatephorus cucumeris (strain AG1-IB / isolate 7/3/14) TaxID=1108050 RepID=A0A0B7FUB6_THACB|nr:hypothetical protein RSOLAG1IB_12474 [Rhizoctonia solani AG-1 IB]
MGRYTYPTVSPPPLSSDEEIIARIVHVETGPGPPPNAHFLPLTSQHERIIGLDHGDNEADDIFASVVDSNRSSSSTRKTTSTARTPIRIKNIHVLIVIFVISMTILWADIETVSPLIPSYSHLSPYPDFGFELNPDCVTIRSACEQMNFLYLKHLVNEVCYIHTRIPNHRSSMNLRPSDHTRNDIN